ncbi:MAG: glutamate racemase [Phycisphaerae bacterium]
MNRHPIAVFDSGVGGLSVVRHLRRLLPHESLVYFGDTARVPYGSKSRRTVTTFALELARFLLQYDPKTMVVACNTASALALDTLAADLPVPVVGVVEPAARAAVDVARGGVIAILGTEATISSDAYPRAITALDPAADVVSVACPLFVPLVEEGRESGDAVVAAIANEYLAPMRAKDVRAAVLGCTHYPMLRAAIASALGADVQLVDSGLEASKAVRDGLAAAGRLSTRDEPASMRCFVSDNPARFRRVGARFLEHELDDVEFVEPERYISGALPHAEPL